MSTGYQHGARIPADIERPDKIVFGLTARQALILGAAGAALWLAFLAVRHVVPAAAFLAAAAPAGAAAAGAVLVTRDGLSLDRLAAAAIRQARAPRRLVTAPGGVLPPPPWAPAAPGALPAPLRLPAGRVTPDGAIDLGADGTAVLLECTTVSFALATPAEQEAMAGAFGRFLNGLSGPVQFLVRAEAVDLSPAIARLRQSGPFLPHPSLHDAALGHAAFLAGLAASRDLLRRQVILVIREPAYRARGGAASRALRRADEAARALAAAGVRADVLDGYQAAAVIAAACDPWRQVPSGSPDAVITREAW